MMIIRAIINKGIIFLEKPTRFPLQKLNDSSNFAALSTSQIKNALQYKEKLEETLELLIKIRSDARANKDFELSDKIRIELDGIGIQLKDSKGGTNLKID